MKTLQITRLILIVAICATTVSFIARKPSVNITTGTYGVCNCGSTTGAKYELTLNADHTFHYYDNGDSRNIIDVKGNWSDQDGTILLTGTTEKTLPVKWKVDKNEKCIKARKGLQWIRLCNLSACN